MQIASLKTVAVIFVAGFLILPLAKTRSGARVAQAATERKRDPTQGFR